MMTSPTPPDAPQPTAAIVGASRDRSKYGNRSVRAHLSQGYRVFPINPGTDEVEGLTAYPSLQALPVTHVDRISMYVPAEVGVTLLEQVAEKTPAEFWLNPGSESEALLERARELGLEPILACSIVDLGMNPRELA